MASNAKQAFGQKESFERKLVGIASVITGESKAKFVLVEDGKTFKNGTNTITLSFDDLPGRPQLPHGDKSGKQYRIRMSGDGKTVEAITPVIGVYELELVDLGPRPEKDSDPMPREKVWNEGTPKENRYLEFFAVYEIADGFYKGCQCPAYNLHYKFQEDENNPGFAGFTFSLSNKQATRGKQLAEWGHLHGVWEVQGTEVVGEPIEWDDETILPELLQRALDGNTRVRGVFKNGYIQELLPSEEMPIFVESGGDDDLDDELPPVDEKFPEKPAKNIPVSVGAIEQESKKSAPVKTTGTRGRNTPKRVKQTSDSDDDEL